MLVSLMTAMVGLIVLATALEAREYYAQLLTTVTSHSPQGTVVSARIMGPVDRDGGSVLPPGTIVGGTVESAQRVGLGFRRERASLLVRFDRCQLPDGFRVDCQPRLVEVDNARETVEPEGRIRGVLAASHVNAWLSGVWVRPGTALSHRAALGLTGTGGVLQSALSPTPLGAAVTVGTRLALFRFPNPEIELPVGADLILEVESEYRGSPAVSSLADERVSPLATIPVEVSRSSGEAVDDILNVALLGERSDVERAFEAAGWTTAVPLTTRTFAKTYRALAAMTAYRNAPVSTLHWDGRPPDLVFQKNFNTLAKRHHVRFWRVDSPAGPVWLGAATHDRSIVFDWKKVSLDHVIDHRIDREREKVMVDLKDAGCVAEETYLERPGVRPAEHIETDRKLAVATLRHCLKGPDGPQIPKLGKGTRVARRFVLETRHYAIRGNPYYWGYRAVRWAVTWPHRPKETTVTRAASVQAAYSSVRQSQSLAPSSHSVLP